MSGTVWINEFHYDNAGTDAGEFIEIAGAAGTDLTGWSLVLYNGNGGTSYTTTPLTGSIPSITGGFGVVSVSYPSNGIQNGGAGASTTEGDAIALVNAGGQVVQFLAYEASLTATNGVASGLTATLIPVGEPGSDAAGGSVHLVGTGTAYADFTWAATTDDSPGAINAGQSFGSVVTESLSINDASITEGNAGTALLTFTLTRSGNAGAFSVDYATADGTASAGTDYVATSGTVNFTAGGSLTQTVSVIINGDTAAEANEGFALNLANLVNTTGATTLGDASGAGTITNDEVSFARIFEIQGAGHKAGLVGGAIGSGGDSGTARVNAEGVVTAIAANGFYIQDATGDGNVNTSDGIFVFTNTSGANFTAGQALAIGNTVQILGAQVSEFRPGAGGLTVSQLSISGSIAGSSINNLGGSATIAPVVLGVDRVMPTGSIASTGFASFDPAIHAADFWESLEGMLVQVTNPVAISPTNEFRTRDPANSANAEGAPNQEIWVTTGSAFDAASQTPRGGLIIAPGDFNPERIQLDDITPVIDMPGVNVGARLSTVVGVVNYDFSNYEVLVSAAPTVTTPSPLTPEVTLITRGPRQLTIGDYNAENLDAEIEDTSAALANATGGVAGSDLYARLGNSDDDIGDGLYAGHARNIAIALGAPLVVALQEVQDDDGGEISTVVSADRTLQTLVDLIHATYGVSYSFAYVSPANNTFGGQPNANIRNAFLYQPEFITLNGVSLLNDPNPGEADLFGGNDFASSRQPLVGEFSFNGVSFTIINNHLNSKGGDGALFGATQPAVLTSEAQRTEQARIINAHVDTLLAADPDARVIIAGDLNDFGWSTPVQTIQGPAGNQVMFGLAEELLPENQRYSYNFDGNTQQLDHQLVSASLLNNAAPAHDILQVNSEFAAQASDHDPSLSRFDFSDFGEVLTGTSRADAMDGQGGDDSLIGGVGNDSLTGGTGNDTLSGGRGNDSMTGGLGNDTYVVDSFTDVVVELDDQGTDTVLTTVGNYTLGAHVENIAYTGPGRFTGNGNALNNAISGNVNSDTLLGGAGNDTLIGGGGNDRLDGGAGNDVVVFSGLRADATIARTGTGNWTVTTASGGTDRLLSVEELRFSDGSLYTSSETAYLTPVASNVRFEALLTAGDVAGVKVGTPDAGAPWRMVGIPDGLGAFDNGNGTITILLNHEIGAANGVVREHGAIGSFVSEIILDKATLAVISAGDLADETYVWNGTSYTLSPTAIARLCSADLPPISAFYDAASGLGTQDRIFMNGEETGAEGRGFAFVATGAEAGTAWELPELGRFSWENSLANPYSGAKTVVIGTDDSTPGQVYLYVGDKQASGTAIEKAGLTNGQLYGIVAQGIGNGANSENLLTTVPLSGSFTLAALANGGNGAALEIESDAAGVTEWWRPEDGAWDTVNQDRFYFVTTANAAGPSRLWALDFVDSANPTLGGTFTALLDGTEGHLMLDNMGVSADGTIILQEDVGGNDRLGKVWHYDPGSDALTEIAQHDPARFTPGAPGFLTRDEESSGAIDVTSMLGDADTRAFLLDTQAHYDFGITGSADRTEIVRGGQLQVMYIETKVNGTHAAETLQGTYIAETIHGLAGADSILAGGGNDSVDGGAGNDTILGGVGHDTLNGGLGNDSMLGGAGSDTYLVNSFTDVVVEASGEGADTVLATLGSFTLGADVENLTYTGIGRFTGNGNALDNAIYGSSNSDTLNGGGGNDTLAGLAGNDRLIGGAGNDVLIGEEGNDVLDGGLLSDGLNGGNGNDVFRFVRGEADGDAIIDFTGNGNAAGDRLVFVGYGSKAAGASFASMGGDQWQITSADGLVMENITITGAVVGQDWVFA